MVQSGVVTHYFMKASISPSLPPQPTLVDIRNRTLGTRRIITTKLHHIIKNKNSQLHGSFTMAS